MIQCGTAELSPLENALCGFHWRTDRPQEKKFDGQRLGHVRKTLGKLPARFRAKVEKLALHKLQKGGDYEAGRYLYDVAGDLSGDYLSLDASDAEIIFVAADLAAQCQGFIADSTQGLPFCSRLAARVGVEVPDVEETGVAGFVARLSDSLWWRRAIRKHIARKVEGHAIELGFVHAHAGKYASNESLERRTQQKRRNQKILESIVSTNEAGQSFTLADLASRSVANPAIRRGELMMRIAGFESLAQAQGHVGEFYTITAPSKYHARRAASGGVNPAYGGFQPRQTQAYLCAVWRRIRAQLAKKGIRLYGFRVAEPMHDGTPHWHMLVFMAPENVFAVRNCIRAQSLKEDGQEPGAWKYRFKAVSIDWNRGSAAGYIAKYIAKNIDGYGLDDDSDGKPLDDASRRVDAWASTWGIRQFQQIGGAPVTTWRELRRVEMGGESGLVWDAARASDSADWKKYLELQGGATVARKDLKIKLLQVWSDARTRYGDERGEIVKGVKDHAISIITRVHVWVSRFSGVGSSWSAVNNCNQKAGKNGKGTESGNKSGGGGGKGGKFDASASENWRFNRFLDLQTG